MNPLHLWVALVAAVTALLFFRFGLWWSRIHLDAIIESRLAAKGMRLSDQLNRIERKATVDRQAQRLQRKLGTAAYVDVMLGGLEVTIVGNSKEHLNRTSAAIHANRGSIEAAMAAATAAKSNGGVS